MDCCQFHWNMFHQSPVPFEILMLRLHFIWFCKPKLRNAACYKQAVFALKHVIWFQVGRRTALGRFMCGCGRQKNYVAWSLRESILLLSGEGVPVICYGHNFQNSQSHCSISNSLSPSLTLAHCHVWSVMFLVFFVNYQNEEKKGNNPDDQFHSFCLV